MFLPSVNNRETRVTQQVHQWEETPMHKFWLNGVIKHTIISTVISICVHLILKLHAKFVYFSYYCCHYFRHIELCTHQTTSMLVQILRLRIWFALSYNWYHFLSLYLSINWCAAEEKFSASVAIFADLSSKWLNFSPRSTRSIRARCISLAAVLCRIARCSNAGGVPCVGSNFATVLGGFPDASPTGIMIYMPWYTQYFWNTARFVSVEEIR